MTKLVEDRDPPFDTIVFDCDSTLSFIEGIEELFPDESPELDQLTNAAMNGDVPLEAVYGRRLEIAQPTADAVLEVGQRYIETALPHAKELIQGLQTLGKRVVIVSGGLLPAVAVFGRALGLADEDIIAVDIYFDNEGQYAGFEENSPVARAGGKLELLGEFPETDAIALIGDGATDLEAAPACARFIAFGGVEKRERVFSAARVHTEEPDLAALLPLLLSPDEIERLETLPDHADLMVAARPFL
ncbi:MAG: phosphoserine phosphatase [Planctomycetota bacterium]